MKKYWIKDLTVNQAIHAPTLDISDKLCEKFHELGMKWSSGASYLIKTSWYIFKNETCYQPKINQYCDKDYCIENSYEILTIDQLLDFQTNEYPKVMEVSEDGNSWFKRVVFMEKNGKFLAWAGAETIEEADSISHVSVWEYAREIQPTLELTIDQIADKFNVSPEQIKIKK